MSSFTEDLEIRLIRPRVKKPENQNRTFYKRWMNKVRDAWKRTFITVQWQVLRGFIYYVGEEGSEELYEVFDNAKSDLASIPRILWSIAGHPAGIYAQAAVLHDDLYKKGKVSRKRADEIFLEAMEVLGVPEWQREALYKGVRAGGWLAWNKHRKAQRKKS